MDNKLSYIKERILYYIDTKEITREAFFDSIGMTYGSFKGANKYRPLNSDAVENILTIYSDINSYWLMTGKGEMLKNIHPDIHLDIHLDDKKDKYSQQIGLHKVAESATLYGDDTNIIEIPIVDISAAAGYGFVNPDFVEQTGSIKLPTSMIKGGGLRYCIRVKSHSMTPTLQDGDLVVVRHLDRAQWIDMPDEHVYLIVDKDGMAFIKRVKNRFDKGFIVLMSDNIDKVNYRNFNLQADEVHNIFHAEWYFSAKMDNINNLYYNRLKTLEDRLDEVEHTIKREIK